MEKRKRAGQGAAWKETALLLRNGGQNTWGGDTTVEAVAGSRR